MKSTMKINRNNSVECLSQVSRLYTCRFQTSCVFYEKAIKFIIASNWFIGDLHAHKLETNYTLLLNVLYLHAPLLNIIQKNQYPTKLNIYVRGITASKECRYFKLACYIYVDSRKSFLIENCTMVSQLVSNTNSKDCSLKVGSGNLSLQMLCIRN